MITVNMIHDEARKNDLSKLHGFENFEYMITLDGEVEKAVAAVKAVGETLYMQLLTVLEPDMGDMAVRAALAYGDNRGCITAESSDGTFDTCLRKVGFTEKAGVYTIEISKVVHYCG